MPRTAIVTGGGGDIGRAIALHLAARGVQVMVASRSADRLEATVQAARGRVESFPGDLSDEAVVDRLFATAADRLGALDLLVNCAGATHRGALGTLRRADFEAMLDANFFTLALCSLRALRTMKQRGSGSVINILSSAAHRQYADQAAYCVAKHAARAFIESVQRELHEAGSAVLVQTISPGGVDTAMVRNAGDAIVDGEWLSPDDVAAAVQYLLDLSPRATVRELHLQRARSRP